MEMTESNEIKTCCRMPENTVDLSESDQEALRRAYRVGLLTNSIIEFLACVGESDLVKLEAMVSALVTWYMENHYTGEASDIEFLKSLVSEEASAMADEMDLDYLEEVSGMGTEGCCGRMRKSSSKDRTGEDCGNTVT